MTFEEQLQTQLVRAAKRGGDTRSARPARAFTVASAASVVAVGIVAVVVLPRSAPDSATPEHGARTVGRPAGVAPSLYDNFGIFRRPRTSADKLPSRNPADKLPTGNRFRVTREQSRLVSDRYGIKAWMVPGIKDVCLVIRAPAGRGRSWWGSVGCGKVEADATYQAGERTIGSTITGPENWRPHRRLVTLLFPDGTSDVQLRRGTTVTQELKVENNAVQVRPMSATSIWWRAPDGTQRHLQFH